MCGYPLFASLRAGTVEVMTDAPQTGSMKHKIHWPIFSPVCISGLFLVGAALGMSIICDWAGIWIDFFLTFGATVLLGAVLYVIQGSFLSTVQEEADRVIETKGESYRLQDAKARTNRNANQSRKPWTPHQLRTNFNQPQCCRFRPFRAAVFGHDSQGKGIDKAQVRGGRKIHPSRVASWVLRPTKRFLTSWLIAWVCTFNQRAGCRFCWRSIASFLSPVPN
jgi:hypothetical protein